MKFVHIAGTNGKGSVAEYINEIITAGGKRCAIFTSPHLVSPCERMRIGNKCIGEKELEKLIAEVKQKKLAVNDTLFAAYTAAALLWFEKMGAQFAVMETGLGGRHDSTNCITPDVVVLTNIDYDHVDILGSSLHEIAEDKCGIIKPNVTVVSAIQQKQVHEVIISSCEKNRSALYFAEDVKLLSNTLEGQKFSFKGKEYFIREIGKYQPENAALAILACNVLGIGEESVACGLYNTILKCRTQYFAQKPQMILDGAHNAASVDMLIDTLNTHFKYIDKVLLFACMKDKDYKEMISKLGSLFREAIITIVDKQRGEAPEVLCEYFSEHTDCTTENDVKKAYSKAIDIAENDNSLLVVCGSFYLAGLIYQFQK